MGSEGNALEEGTVPQLDFEKLRRIAQRDQHVVPVVLQDADGGEVLFVGYANAEALRETLRTMSAGLVGEASFALELLGAHLDEDAIAASPEVKAVVDEAIAALRAEIDRQAGDDIPVFPLR